MYACSSVSNRTLTALGRHTQQLRTIDICGAALVTDAGLEVRVDCGARLYLSYLCAVNDDPVQALEAAARIIDFCEAAGY